MKIKTFILTASTVGLLGIATVIAAPAPATNNNDGNGRTFPTTEEMSKLCGQSTFCSQMREAMFSKDGEMSRMGMMGTMMGGEMMGGRMQGYHDDANSTKKEPPKTQGDK